jgi:hypothetical protein
MFLIVNQWQETPVWLKRMPGNALKMAVREG